MQLKFFVWKELEI